MSELNHCPNCERMGNDITALRSEINVLQQTLEYTTSILKSVRESSHEVADEIRAVLSRAKL